MRLCEPGQSAASRRPRGQPSSAGGCGANGWVIAVSAERRTKPVPADGSSARCPGTGRHPAAEQRVARSPDVETSKADGGELEHTSPGNTSRCGVLVPGPGGCTGSPVLDQRPLGRAGRAGGVDHVGRVAGAQGTVRRHRPRVQCVRARPSAVRGGVRARAPPGADRQPPRPSLGQQHRCRAASPTGRPAAPRGSSGPAARRRRPP